MKESFKSNNSGIKQPGENGRSSSIGRLTT